jgi:hypothetical protein
MANHNPLPPLARLNELLTYDPQEGVLRWRVSVGGRPTIGRVAGGVGKDGYVQIQVDRVRYAAHRIAYYMGTGIDPLDHQVDHYPDATRSNNRLANLRLAINTADNCSTRTHKRTQPVVIIYADGLLLQCPSQLAAAHTLGCARKTIQTHLRSGTPTAMGHRLYAYPRMA